MSKQERRELDRASDLLDKGRSDEAIAKLEILRTSSEAEVHDLALNFLANAYAATARNAEAESMLRQSIEERGTPNDGLGSQLAALAPLVRRQGRNEEAEEIYLRALDVQRPDGPEIKVITSRNLAYVYWCTGRPEKATETYANLPECDDGFLDFLAGVMKPYIEPEIPA
jgi:tetratricopeptide (TPR) repeat protein